jgi:hypothetical protein
VFDVGVTGRKRHRRGERQADALPDDVQGPNDQAPDEKLYIEMGKFIEEMTASGVLLATGGLSPKSIRVTSSWHYNGQVTYWARTAPPDRRRKSRTDYCAEIDRSPQWTDEDRHGLRTP